MATRFNIRKHPLAVSAQTALRLSPLAFSKYLVAMSLGGTSSFCNKGTTSIRGPSPFSAVTISLRRKKKFLSLPAAHIAFALEKFPRLTSYSTEVVGAGRGDLLHSDIALSEPLTQLTPALAELAVKLFTSHIKTIEKPPLASSLSNSTKSLALVHFELVLIGRVCVSMRDEILLQLVKQLRYPPLSTVVGGGIVNSTNSNMHTEHPDPLARERLWRALCVCVCAFPPSQAFENFFELFLLEHASTLSSSWSLYGGSNTSSEQNHAHTARRCLRLMHTSIYLYGQDKSMSHLNVYTHIHAYAHHMQHHYNNHNSHSSNNILSRDNRHESISTLSLFLVQQWLSPETYTTALLKKERVGTGGDFNAEVAFLDPAFDYSDRSRQQQQQQHQHQQGEERPLVADGGKITVYEIGGGGGGVSNNGRSGGIGAALSILPSSKSFLWLPKKMLQTQVDASGGGGKVRGEGSKIDLDGGLEGYCRGTREDWRERFKRVFSQDVNTEEQVGRKGFLDAMVKLGGSSAEEENGANMDWLDACVLKFLVYGEKPASMISLSRELRAASNSFFGICSASEEEIRTMRIRREWLIQHTKTHADVALTPPFTLHERQVLASLLWDEVLEKLIVHANAASAPPSSSLLSDDATTPPAFLTWPIFRDVIIIGLETALVEEEMKRELEQEQEQEPEQDAEDA